MKTTFTQFGKDVYLGDGEKSTMMSKLPPHLYVLKVDPRTGDFYLEQGESFTLPDKLYSNLSERADRIRNTFLSRDRSTGVLLLGEKGSGKTLLAKKISLDCQNDGIPTIVINASYQGVGFNTFLQSIQQPVVILIDEFEKLYNYERKNADELLTLLDGVYQAQRLILLTANEKDRVSYYMQNRPGRIYYSYEFKGIDEAFAAEYCKDRLKDQAFAEDITKYLRVYSSMNFDMLQAIVEEHNRYGEALPEMLTHLNIQPEMGYDGAFVVTLSTKETTATVSENYSISDIEEFEMWVCPGMGASQDDKKKINQLFDYKEEGEGVVAFTTAADKLRAARKGVSFSIKQLKKFDQKEKSFIFEQTVGDTSYLLTAKKTARVNFSPLGLITF